MLYVSPRPFRFLPVLFPLLIILASGCNSATAAALETGDPAPDWILSNPRGEAISFYQDSKGQPAVLIFWATWCTDCTRLMQELEKLRQQLKGEKKVRFYALNFWEGADPVSHMKDNGSGFTLLLNADTVAKRYGVRRTPGLFVVDENKEIQYIRSADDSPEETYEAAKTILGATGN